MGDHQRFLTPQDPSPDDDLRGSKQVTPIEFGQPLLSQSGDSETTHVPPGSVRRRPPHPKRRPPKDRTLIDLPQASTPRNHPTHAHTGGSGTGPERALERRHPNPPRASARKPSQSPRSLRAQDRSRGVPSRHGSPAPAPALCHRKTGESSRGMRRSFRTLRLCAIPGVSPRGGMRRPVGALRTPHLPQSLPAPQRSGSGNGPERALEAIKPIPRAKRESPILPRASLQAQDRSRGAPPKNAPEKAPLRSLSQITRI